MLRGMRLNDHPCSLFFVYVQLQAAGSGVDQRLSVYYPDKHCVPLSDTDAHICIEFIRTNRATHVNDTGNL